MTLGVVATLTGDLQPVARNEVADVLVHGYDGSVPQETSGTASLRRVLQVSALLGTFSEHWSVTGSIAVVTTLSMLPPNAIRDTFEDYSHQQRGFPHVRGRGTCA